MNTPTSDARSNAPSSSESSSRRLLAPAAAIVAGLAAIAALVCVVVFGVRAVEVYTQQYPTQQVRNDATAAAEQVVLNITTIDPADLDGFRERAAASLTGEAAKQVLGEGEQGNVLDMLEQAGPGTATLTARLLRSAPSEVDADADRARILVYVATTLQRPGQPGVDETRGFDVSMVKDGDTWKADNIIGLEGIVYDDAAGGGPAPAPAPAPEGGN